MHRSEDNGDVKARILWAESSQFGASSKAATVTVTAVKFKLAVELEPSMTIYRNYYCILYQA